MILKFHISVENLWFWYSTLVVEVPLNHSFLVSRIIRETGEMSRVLLEILSLSRVFLSRVSPGEEQGVWRREGPKIRSVSRIFWDPDSVSRNAISRIPERLRKLCVELISLFPRQLKFSGNARNKLFASSRYYLEKISWKNIEFQES